MSAPLDVSDLRKQFSIGRPAVDGVSFHVAAGEIVVLLGPSGCGKTTTLALRRRARACDRRAHQHRRAGGVGAGGRRAGAAAPARHRHGVPVLRGLAAHDGAPERRLSAAPSRRSRAPRSTARSTRCWSWWACREYAERSVVALSGGQMQRVALARSLVYQPQLLLLDEPLSNLDAKLRLRLRDDLRRIIKQTGVTALYVTHDQAEAVVLGDRIGVMRDGKLLQIGSPDEIYNRPGDLFVASFTGASNLLAGRVLAREGEFGSVEAGGQRLTAWLPAERQGRRCGQDRGAAGERAPRRQRRGRAQPFQRARLRPALPGHADRLRARHAGRHGSRRSSSAPACATRSAATSRSCCRRRCAGPILRTRRWPRSSAHVPESACPGLDHKRVRARL